MLLPLLINVEMFGGAVLPVETPASATGGAAPWQTESWRKKKHKRWQLPPPQFPLVEEPSALVPVLQEPPSPALPAWQRPRGRYRGLVYRAPVVPVQIPAPSVVRHRTIPAQTTTPIREDTWAKIKTRQRQDDEVILSLLMQELL